MLLTWRRPLLPALVLVLLLGLSLPPYVSAQRGECDTEADCNGYPCIELQDGPLCRCSSMVTGEQCGDDSVVDEWYFIAFVIAVSLGLLMIASYSAYNAKRSRFKRGSEQLARLVIVANALLRVALIALGPENVWKVYPHHLFIWLTSIYHAGLVTQFLLLIYTWSKISANIPGSQVPRLSKRFIIVLGTVQVACTTVGAISTTYDFGPLAPFTGMLFFLLIFSTTSGVSIVGFRSLCFLQKVPVIERRFVRRMAITVLMVTATNLIAIVAGIVAVSVQVRGFPAFLMFIPSEVSVMWFSAVIGVFMTPARVDGEHKRRLSTTEAQNAKRREEMQQRQQSGSSSGNNASASANATTKAASKAGGVGTPDGRFAPLSALATRRSPGPINASGASSRRSSTKDLVVVAIDIEPGEEEKAAIKIQAAVRGHQARRQAAQMRASSTTP